MSPLPIYPSCDFCIEGLQPVGIHPILGPIFQHCLYCSPPCPACDGTALFPAFGMFGGSRIHHALAKKGLFATQCHTCSGITAVAPINREAPHDQT